MALNNLLLSAFFIGFAALAQIPPQSDPNSPSAQLPNVPAQPGHDPSGPGAILPGDTQPMPPDFDSRNPSHPRVAPTPNNRVPGLPPGNTSDPENQKQGGM